MYYDEKKGLYREQITINGKRRVFSGKTKKALKMKILTAQDEVKHLPTFGVVALRWKEAHKDEIEPGTWRCYDSPLKRILKEYGLRRLDDIKPGELQTWLNGLGLAYKTVRNHKTVLSEVFNFAIVHEGIDIPNPCDHIKVSEKLAKGSRRALEDWEIAEIRKTTAEEFILAPVILYTGCRCGEALAGTPPREPAQHCGACWMPGPGKQSERTRAFILQPSPSRRRRRHLRPFDLRIPPQATGLRGHESVGTGDLPASSPP